MEQLKHLDEALMSDDALSKFKSLYADPEFKTWLTSIIPEIEDCANQKQDNPWHIYDCLDHILHSVEEMNKQTKNLPDSDRKLLAYSMLYHDIGKPASHIRRFGKAYGREIDSFFNHNKKSAEVVKRSAKDFGFNESEAKIIEKLVYDHDIFMFITENKNGNPHHKLLTNELIAEHVQELSSLGDGKTLMEYLIKIGRADNKAQNPEMTEKSLHMLDTMENMLKSMNPSDFEVQKQNI